MITIGSIKFDFQANNEHFASQLNAHWERDFQPSIERIVDEVLLPYDLEDKVVTIDSLQLDLGTIPEEDFSQQFIEKFQETLLLYCNQYLSTASGANPLDEVKSTSIEASALDILCFFLLHGYLPYPVDTRFTDLGFLLQQVLQHETYAFKDFLEAYGHYDFICHRLVYQFKDEELEQIIETVHPSESKFITLYVQLQLHAFRRVKNAEMNEADYRNVVWILLFTYLYTEAVGHFNKKQMILYTLQGLSAHFNVALIELLHWLTENIVVLKEKMAVLPELGSLLDEIGKEIQMNIMLYPITLQDYILRETVAFLRMSHDSKNASVLSLLSFEHLSLILGDAIYCRRLLSQLKYSEIHSLVGIVIPHEEEFIISYAKSLDRHKESGRFSGKAGGEFRLLKWEFIFAVISAFPSSSFNRKVFVITILKRLANHYNLSVLDLIHLLHNSEIAKEGHILTEGLFPVLMELETELSSNRQVFSSVAVQDILQEELTVLFSTSSWGRQFLACTDEYSIYKIVNRVFSDRSNLIIAYSKLLDSGSGHGILEGKAGNEFRELKWEFIFIYLLYNKSNIFHQKLFVLSVIRQLAAHYNIDVIELLNYFFHYLEITDVVWDAGLKQIFQELYDEYAMPLSTINSVKQFTTEEREHWMLCLFGKGRKIGNCKDDYAEKWLIYLLEEYNDVFSLLWKSGKIDTAFIFRLVNKKPALQQLWIRKIGDSRISEIYRNGLNRLVMVFSNHQESVVIDSLVKFLSVWLVELTAPRYLEWSEQEIIQFLLEHGSRGMPHGFAALTEGINKDKEITEIVKRMNKPEKNETMKQNEIAVSNAGLTVLAPFFPRLFAMLNLLGEDRHSFKDELSQIKAIFLMQYILYGEEKSNAETELAFNKILVGWESQKPLPTTFTLGGDDMNCCNEMMNSVKNMWEKMKHTSLEALRASFLQRKGIISFQDEQRVYIKVEQKAFDILLDSLPWNFTVIKYPWMDKIIIIEWRTR